MANILPGQDSPGLCLPSKGVWCRSAPVLLLLAAFGLYALTRANSFNGDGMGQVAWIVWHDPKEGLHPRYILYVPFLRGLHALLGSPDPMAYIRTLQITNAALAALGLLFAYALCVRWLERAGDALLVAACVGLSWAFWEHATDVHYVMLGSTALLGSLVVPFRLAQTRLGTRPVAVLSGLASALAAMCYLGNVCGVPAAAFATYWSLRRTRDNVRGGSVVCWYLGTLVILGVIAFLVASTLVPQARGADAMIHWVAERNSYPGWSEFTVATPRRACAGFLNSFQAHYCGLHLRELIGGHTSLKMLPSQISFLLVAGLLVLCIPLAARRYRSMTGAGRSALLFAIFWALPFLVYSTYQCPDDEQFYISVLVPVFMTLCLLPIRVGRGSVLAVLPVVLFFGNLTNPVMAQMGRQHLRSALAAREAGAFLKPNDLVITPIYDWTSLLPVFAQRDAFCTMSLADRNASQSVAIRRFSERVSVSSRLGGSVYISSVNTMNEASWRWVESTTSLPRTYVAPRIGKVVWSRHGHSLWSFDGGPARRCR